MDEVSVIAERVEAQGMPITREAREYALKELARRAGVTTEVFRSWKVVHDAEQTTVYVQAGTQKRIRFRIAPLPFQRDLLTRIPPTARADWWHAPPEPVRSLIPDFRVPFSDGTQHRKRPLFAPVDENSVECTLDLPLSILLSLSRWEEQLPGDRDIHGCFPSSLSVAVRDGFLNRPVVEEYGFALEQALMYLLPRWHPVERKLRVKLSHDIDTIGLPFNFRATVGHTVRRRKPVATVRDLLGWVVGLDPSYLGAVRQITQLSLDRGVDSAVYWKASPRSPLDSGYDPRHPKVLRVIAWLRDHGIEMGVHPGYQTFRSPERLQREVQILREVLGDQPLGGRQHYLRWCPRTWVDWENCGLVYDSTLGHGDRTGFRAGTCIPYRPWLFSLNREARLIEIPLIVMEDTLLTMRPVPPRHFVAAVLEHLPRCRLVGGVFTLLWHNSNLIDPTLCHFYETILDELMEYGRFDCSTPPTNLC